MRACVCARERAQSVSNRNYFCFRYRHRHIFFFLFSTSSNWRFQNVNWRRYIRHSFAHFLLLLFFLSLLFFISATVNVISTSSSNKRYHTVANHTAHSYSDIVAHTAYASDGSSCVLLHLKIKLVYKLSVNRRPPFNRRPYNSTRTMPDRWSFLRMNFPIRQTNDHHHLAPSIYRSLSIPFLLLSLPNELECNLFCEIA